MNSFAEYVALHDYSGPGGERCGDEALEGATGTDPFWVVDDPLACLASAGNGALAAGTGRKGGENCWKHCVMSCGGCTWNCPRTTWSPGPAATSARVTRRPGYVAIKPSGVRYEDLRPEHMVVVDLEGRSSRAISRRRPIRPAISTSTGTGRMSTAWSTPIRATPPPLRRWAGLSRSI